MSVPAQMTRKFFHFFDIVVTSVCGLKCGWTKNLKVSESASTCGLVTISDEAFAELLL
jgi:hypothetical protein